MSRSYKKYPVVKQEKVDKKFWHKSVRNLDFNFSLRGSQYKKVIRNYNNWHYRWTLEEAIEDYVESERFPTLDSWVEHWKRSCLRK